MEDVTLNLANMFLNGSYDNLKITPEVMHMYEKYLINNRTPKQIEEQAQAKEKLNMIKSVDVEEKLDLGIDKIELLEKIKKELKELKAFILSFRLNNLELRDYQEVYFEYIKLSMLYSYLKEDIDSQKSKVK